jgi:S1-C subfamily serine protease
MHRELTKWTVVVLLAAGVGWGQARSAPDPAKTLPHPGDAYLGIEPRDISPDRISELKLKDAHGVEVSMVDQDGPAARAGVKEHDVVLTFEGSQVENAQELRQRLHETPAGRTVVLGISRNGQGITLSVPLASRRQMLAASGPNHLVHVPEIHMPPLEFDFPQFAILWFWQKYGLVVEDLTPQLGEFFGVRNGEGVLIRWVEKGSAAEAAGIKAGDVVVKVNSQPIACGADWHHAIGGLHDDAVSLGIVRNRREQTVSLKPLERKTSTLFEFPVPQQPAGEV